MNKRKLNKILKQLRKIYNCKFIFISQDFYLDEEGTMISYWKWSMFGVQNRVIQFNSIFELEMDLENTIYGYKKCCVPTERGVKKFIEPILEKGRKELCIKIVLESRLRCVKNRSDAEQFVETIEL